jgi:hypothetical protein
MIFVVNFHFCLGGDFAEQQRGLDVYTITFKQNLYVSFGGLSRDVQQGGGLCGVGNCRDLEVEAKSLADAKRGP